MYQAIWRGGYPGLLELPDDLVQPHHRSYMQTYIERDVRVVAGVAIYSYHCAGGESGTTGT